MEQPPPGSLDDLQPQDLSTCSSIPAVISVTGQSEECVLDASSMEALQMVRSANWYPHSGNSITGLPFLEAAPPDGRLLQPGDRIQPDNAFSNTTLTLSYVSRSHLFSTHDSLAQHSGLYGVPAIGKFSLPPSFESEKGLGEAGCALGQHYLEQNDSPLDLATQTELFQCFSQAQEGIENAVGVCLTQQSHEFNGAVVSIDGSQDKCLQSRTEHGAIQDTVNSCGVENFQSDSWADSGACIQPLPNSLAANMGEPTVVFLLSGTPGPVVIPDGVHNRDLCSLSGNYVSPLEDPVSPSATSLDGGEAVFSLPVASSSPSAENSRVETPKEPMCWERVNGGEPAIQPAALVGVGSGGGAAVTTDASNRYKSPGSRRKAVLEPLIDLTEEDDFLSEVMEENAKTSTLPHLNGKAPALQKSFQKKELPMRSGRGMRLEAIVMNINASRHKPLTCINTAKKTKASPHTASISKVVTVSPKKDSSKKKASLKAPVSAKRTKPKAATAQRRRRPNGINTDSCKQSTSECETSNDSKTSHSSTPPKKPSPRVDVHKKAKNKQGDVSQQQPIQSPEHSPYFHVHNGSKSKANHGLIAEPPLKSSPQLSKRKKPPRQRKRAACHVPTAEIDAAVKISSPPAKSPKKSNAKQTTHDSILEPPLKSSPQPSKQKKPPRQRKRASRHAPTAEIDAAERMSSPLAKSPKKSPAKQTNHGSIADPQLNSSPQFSKHKKSQRQPKHASRHTPTVEINAVRTSPSPAKSPKKSPAKQAHCGSIPEPLLKSSPQLSKHEKSPKQPKHVSQRAATTEIDTVRMSSPQAKSPKKSPTKHKKNNEGSRTPPSSQKAKKVSHTPKKKKKKRQKFRPTMQSSMFSPKEPEIKLRYVNYKEEKRDRRLDSFSPFIRREAKLSSPALCTVINYPEQEQSRPKKGQGRSGGGFMSGAVPSTSCLQLGRASAHSQHRRSLVCCLCGESANAMDLGDLHGPYYPEGYQPGTKTPESTAPGLKDDEDFSDSDSSLCSERGRNRANPLIPWQRKPKRHLLKRKGPSLESQWWAGDGERCSSPAAKRARVDTDPTEAEEEDWYSPPVVALEPCEYWFHEDCGIWSAGVFLVKGKVYGLEEAVTVAQETMCSGCHGSGATLGCFFKGCPCKYHYRCALESGCVLTEDNFSMKCKKHKYKTLKAPPGTRRNDR